MLFVLRSLCAASLILTSAACRSNDMFSRTPVAQREKATLTVVEKCAGGEDSFEYEGARYCPRGDALQLTVDAVDFAQDQNGYGGPYVEFTRLDAARARAWSAQHLGSTVAILARREPLIVRELSGPIEQGVIVYGNPIDLPSEQMHEHWLHVRSLFVAERHDGR